jgi:ATP-binding cassette subfamily B protein
MRFTYYKQLNAMDCGPTCLRMIAKHYGRHYNADTIREMSGFGKQGVSMLGISETAEKLGFRTRGVQISYEKLRTAPVPATLHWNQSHFVVLVDAGRKSVTVADPAIGLVNYNKQEFLKYWISNAVEGSGEVGTALLMEPSPAFYSAEGEKESKLSWILATRYLYQNKKALIQIGTSILIGLLFQLVTPFLTQSMVDTGIATRDMSFITVILFAQLSITLGSTVIGFIRSRIQMRMSNRINIAILSDFWIKLTRLPISYFDVHQAGDTIQRIGDNRQIQSFLTGQALSSMFSMLNFLIYSVILIVYNPFLFLIFSVGNLAYFGWIRLFMGFRRKLNYESFYLSAKENNSTLQMVQGMQEIRLNNAEQLKRWEWENIQARIFKLNFKSLNYGQWQAAGALFINRGKDIFISYTVAELVVQGQLTFGAMLSVQYIIGSLSGPVQDFINLAQSLQDARISMERLNEIHQMEDEEPADKPLISDIAPSQSISFRHLSFTYPGAGNDAVLEDIDLEIPAGKVTAIVGVSGSGKTTLLKILLKIYEQYSGELKVGDVNLRYISPSYWRRQCGSVLQDGYIFNDTVARNIAVGDQIVDRDRLLFSCQMANISSFLESMPNGFNTRLGADGVGISQGQRQRLLIARAIYKDPQFMFFDEATNALDANNERVIVDNLQQFFEGRTVVVVAHRLSTVKNADKIVVLHEGRIVEEGSHQLLSTMKGHYYQLVKNQLELGN